MQVPFRRPAGALLGLALFTVPAPGKAASPAAAASDAWLDSTSARWNEVSEKIWGFSETALQETKSAALLIDVLEKEGFSVTRGVAGMPTAFVASAGTGTPVIGILAEYDALLGLSQVGGAPKKTPLAEGAPGHGCGHNLLGTAAVAAAVAANRSRVAAKLPGTIRVFGTPAEEQLLGKPFMLRDGVFAGTDAVLAWHPADANYVCTKPYLAIAAVDVEFFGKTAHAAMNPWLGRSALDAVEIFDHALALMREHVLPTARLHRAIKNGGLAANIIPDYARVQWFVRDENGERVNEMIGRLRKAAEGAASRRRRPRRSAFSPRRASRFSTASSRRSFRGISFASARPRGTPPTSRSRAAFRRRSAFPRPASRTPFSPMLPATGPGPRPTWERRARRCRSPSSRSRRAPPASRGTTGP